MKSCEPRRSRDHVRNGTGVAIPPTLRELHALVFHTFFNDAVRLMIKQAFCGEIGFHLNQAVFDKQPFPSLPLRCDQYLILRADQPRTLAVISATRRPNARAMARSSGPGCNSPCPPALS